MYEAAAEKCELIVSHHPLMNCHWTPVQTLREDDAKGRLLRDLVRKNLSCICMHTNLDRAPGGVNDCLVAALGLTYPEPLPTTDGFCRRGKLASPVPLGEYVQKISAALHCNGVRYADGGKPVYRVAVGGGACGEYADLAADTGCDTFITSDVKYHDFLDAAARGLNLIDAGHFPTENPVCQKLTELLRVEFPTLTVLKSTSHREVTLYYMEGE